MEGRWKRRKIKAQHSKARANEGMQIAETLLHKHTHTSSSSRPKTAPQCLHLLLLPVERTCWCRNGGSESGGNACPLNIHTTRTQARLYKGRYRKSNSFAHLLAAERKMYRTCSCSVRHVPLMYLQGKERKMPVRVKVSGSGSWDMREFWP